MQYDLKVLFLVFNNGMYGTIRMHQERDYPARVHATALRNPDFAALASAYGLFGVRVERTEQFADALKHALAHDTAALIEICVDPEAITTRTKLSAIRENALKQQEGREQ